MKPTLTTSSLFGMKGAAGAWREHAREEDGGGDDEGGVPTASGEEEDGGDNAEVRRNNQ